MEINELMVGNWIAYRKPYKNSYTIHTGQVTNICQRSPEGKCVEFNFWEKAYRMDELSPLILTKQWLRDFGAMDFPDGSLILNDRLIGYAECRQAFYDMQTGLELKWVHQFQNFHKIMTGISLVRKEKANGISGEK